MKLNNVLKCRGISLNNYMIWLYFKNRNKKININFIIRFVFCKKNFEARTIVLVTGFQTLKSQSRQLHKSLI